MNAENRLLEGKLHDVNAMQAGHSFLKYKTRTHTKNTVYTCMCNTIQLNILCFTNLKGV